MEPQPDAQGQGQQDKPAIKVTGAQPPLEFTGLKLSKGKTLLKATNL